MKIAIIGSGVIGLSAAYFLSRDGHEVTIFDRRQDVGLETSFGSACVLSPIMSQPWNAPGVSKQILKSIYDKSSPLCIHLSALPSLFTWGITFLYQSKESRFLKNANSNIILAQHNLKLLTEIFDKHDIKINQGQGSLRVYRQQYSFDITKHRLKSFKTLSFDVLSPQDMIEIEPALKPLEGKVIGGLYNPNDRYGDAYLFCKQLSDICRKQGVIFKFNTPIHSLKKHKNLITGLNTPVGVFEFDRYVISAGSYSYPLCRSIQLPLSVRPLKGYSITVPISSRMIKPKVAVTDYDHHVAITPIGHHLRVASTTEFVGFCTHLRKKRIDNLVTLLKRTYPKAMNASMLNQDLHPWTGLRPMSADGVPIIGQSPYLNLFLNTGHGHLGWTTAVGSGQLLSDLIAKRKTDIPKAPYQYGR